MADMGYLHYLAGKVNDRIWEGRLTANEAINEVAGEEPNFGEDEIKWAYKSRYHPANE